MRRSCYEIPVRPASQWKPAAPQPRNDNAMNQPLLPASSSSNADAGRCIFHELATNQRQRDRYNFLVYIWLADIRGDLVKGTKKTGAPRWWFMVSSIGIYTLIIGKRLNLLLRARGPTEAVQVPDKELDPLEGFRFRFHGPPRSLSPSDVTSSLAVC